MVVFAMVVAASVAYSASQSASPLSEEARHTRGEVLVCRFSGEFIKSGLPTETTKAIPLDRIDASFLVVVGVREIREGELPGDWRERIVFAVHSPSRFFGQRGISPPEGSDHPPGVYALSLWRLPGDEGFVLDVAADSQKTAGDMIDQELC